jgi:hypothetical protein
MASDTDELTVRLGPVIATYKAKPFNVATNMVSSIGCSTIGVALTIWAILLIIQDESMCAVPAGGAFFAFLIAILAVYELRQERGFAVTFYENGLQSQLASQTNIALWREITGLTQSKTLHIMTNDTRYEFRLQKQDGAEILIAFRSRGITPNGQELAELLQNKINQEVTPRLVAQFAAGETLSFGPFQLNQETLAYEEKSISWSELEKAAIREGQIVIWQREGPTVWARSEAALVPNTAAFVAILEQKLQIEEVDLVVVHRERPRRRRRRR